MDGNLEKIKKILKNNIQINNSNKKKEYLNSCTQCVMGVRTYKKSDKNNKDEKKNKNNIQINNSNRKREYLVVYFVTKNAY